MWAKICEKADYLDKNGLTIKGAAQYLCEYDSDVETLPTEHIVVGSSAIVITSGNTFILGPSRVWLQYNGVSVFNDSGDSSPI